MMPAPDAADGPQPRSFWIPVICGAAILTIGSGARQSFGISQKPIAADLRVGRELWSVANALAMLLMGVFSPFLGNLADRFGTARTVGAGRRPKRRNASPPTGRRRCPICASYSSRT
jgi:MFS family permease